MLGHEDAVTTLRLYTHLFDRKRATGEAALDLALDRERGVWRKRLGADAWSPLTRALAGLS